MKFKLIACEILFREINFVVSNSPHEVDVEFLTKGFHDLGKEEMSSRLSKVINDIDESEYDAVLLGYGLCNGGVTSLFVREVQLVIPRVHDCISLFLGDRQRYLDYFTANSGVYFLTTGWIERGGELTQAMPDSIAQKLGLNFSKEELTKKYGTKNAEYLYDKLNMMRHYSKLTFIETGVEPDNSFEIFAKNYAKEKNLKYEKLKGNLSLLQKLVNGDWNDKEFLIIKPNQKIAFAYDDNILTSVELCK
ncbi:MAG: DUF1638 domain-containing protein [Planctomycetaceae bacterium]|jgi:hypothetical protein|nr:DUF1638 domain-containing protein [Planctomycetaceae bacterium]